MVLRVCVFGGTIQSPYVLRALKKIGCKEIVFQVGDSYTVHGEYEKEGVKLNLYKFKRSIQEDIENSDLVISHAGAGTCIEVLEAGKPLLVVINEDLKDNHQLELAKQLQGDGHLYYCTSDRLISTLSKVDFSILKPFPRAIPSMFVKFLDDIFKLKQNIG